ncbi:tRNA (cytosine(32)/uridine(32)-2'-O)-methyltransferase TrmJ [Aestuariirhabdus litorea]|uniref:tRNA (cytidine/uridine-2'-O-)-methyltransferase TrmJ n=1 Tax=Aestuariirhabdus litorea TaxID=2528527 RepID=A0A3P3VMR8_9GAMM|nr:tRNA (cytosine(32)/uridine(32)-2'-O)-methyltransferase TrmJ [Aestuariirhabdus litorea]RRJ84051.1 tRNA (cytosine(32)/uridine(32)-2'-O)-methyltransferase TrmJ [Aestuariirhabdus litorea]RWW97271.1 tRNA (cytosine(32)/uridine(32)-2'-O)-methyltransferase TrmJ [Endozoicomonadaceae bacterium GTF-13]
MLDNVRIVLINTFHPGNIGSAARAMKTMGLRHLYLVDPEEHPSPQSEAMAAGAKDLLASAVVVSSLEEAIADCSVVIGTSARNRTLSLPQLDARQCGEMVARESASNRIALVFGRETMGLHNEELQQCNYHVYIPANPEYPVLNLAAAVQLLSYEVYQSLCAFPAQGSPTPELPESRELGYFYDHLEQTLDQVGFIVTNHPGQAMARLKRLFNRARPDKQELNILRGVLSRIQQNASARAQDQDAS